MAWLKWRGTTARGSYHAIWWEGRGRKRRKRSRALSRNENTAKAMLRELAGHLERGAVGLARVVPLSQLKADYIKHLRAGGAATTYLQRVQIALGHLERLYPRLKVPQVTADLLDDYKARREREGVERSTINRELGVIKQAVRKGRRWAYQVQDLSDVSKMKVGDKAKSGYGMGEVRDLIACAPPPLRLVAQLGLLAGLRRGEILQLRWVDVDFKAGKIVLGDGWRTKTGKTRAVPIHPQLMEPLLHAAGGRMPQDRVLDWKASPQALTGAFTSLRRRAGIPKGSIHRLRHTFVTAMANANVEKSKRMRTVGHTSDRTHEGYTHLEVEDLRHAVDAVNYALKPSIPGGKQGSENAAPRESLTVQVGQSAEEPK
jgi:integrase